MDCARVTWGLVVLAALMVAGGTRALHRAEPEPDDEAPPCAVEFREPGWSLRTARRFPEHVSAVMTAEPPGGGASQVFVGTTPVGHIYKFTTHNNADNNMLEVASGLGDFQRFGMCIVVSLALRDLDRDGVPELLATTSQVLPAGRPRLFVWSMNPTAIPRGVARPEIGSHWSHGMAFVPGGPSDRLLVTYCGEGEVVEFGLHAGEGPGGFRFESVGWKQVGRLPASGEAADAADVDGDGRVEVVLGTGYVLGRAALEISERPEPGAPWRPDLRIDEGGRFGNVRFFLADRPGAGSGRDLYAWWVSDIDGGDCELIRYRVGPSGVRHREVLGRGPAARFWPQDGQVAAADLDGDGVPAIWFATNAGHLWRIDPRAPAGDGPTLVCRVEDGLGAIAGGKLANPERPGLFLACRKAVLRLEASPAAR